MLVIGSKFSLMFGSLAMRSDHPYSVDLNIFPLDIFNVHLPPAILPRRFDRGCVGFKRSIWVYLYGMVMFRLKISSRFRYIPSLKDIPEPPEPKPDMPKLEPGIPLPTWSKVPLVEVTPIPELELEPDPLTGFSILSHEYRDC